MELQEAVVGRRPTEFRGVSKHKVGIPQVRVVRGVECGCERVAPPRVAETLTLGEVVVTGPVGFNRHLCDP